MWNMVYEFTRSVVCGTWYTSLLGLLYVEHGIMQLLESYEKCRKVGYIGYCFEIMNRDGSVCISDISMHSVGVGGSRHIVFSFHI